MNALRKFWKTATTSYRNLQARRALQRDLDRAPGINFHRRNPRNIGDIKAGPAEYLDFLRPFAQIEIFRCKTEFDLRGKPVIVGGGGLFSNEFFAKYLRRIVDSSPGMLVCWGAGQNTHHSTDVAFPEILRAFKLVGLRDDGGPYEWVPCASCLDPAFDLPHTIEHEVVLYNHAEFSSLRDLAVPQMENSETDFRKIIAFLASGDTVLTTSYHGAYWATLLGRKVVVLNAFSSKFLRFRHPPQLSSDSDWKRSAAVARSYPDALRECRLANLQFADKVRDAIGYG
jgi:hypothetical protein